jgi:microcystin degradation protein MlrC
MTKARPAGGVNRRGFQRIKTLIMLAQRMRLPDAIGLLRK